MFEPACLCLREAIKGIVTRRNEKVVCKQDCMPGGTYFSLNILERAKKNALKNKRA